MTLAKTMKIWATSAAPTVASATAISPPSSHRHFLISGSTAITSIIMPKRVGQTIMLRGTGTATIDTTAGTVVPFEIDVGASNINLGAGDIVTLVMTENFTWVAATKTDN